MGKGLHCSLRKIFLWTTLLIGVAAQTIFAQSSASPNLSTLSFTTNSISVTEGDGSIDLTIELVKANQTGVDVEVAFITDASTATNGKDIANYTTQTISFGATASAGDTQTISIKVTDDSSFEETEKAVFQLRNINKGTIIQSNTITLIINDNDKDSEPPEIVINEIFPVPDADAIGNGKVNSTDDGFVEFVNNSPSNVDISRWTLSDNSNLRHTFPDGTIIPASGALVLFANENVNPKGTYNRGAIIQRANESSTFGLQNESGVITLADADGNVVTSVRYEGTETEESITRNPDIKGNFIAHTIADADGHSIFSPGTKADGTPFSSNHAIDIQKGEGWRMISAPTKKTALQDLLGNFWTQGIRGSNDPAGAKTIYSWTEPEGGGFMEPSGMSESMEAGRGYIVYFFEDDDFDIPGVQGGFPKIVSSNNDENDNTVSVSVSATDADGLNGIDKEEGWNLLGNPFETGISVKGVVDALEAANKDVNAYVYIWDEGAGNGNGAYVPLEGGKIIAPFQAFFVRFMTDGVNENITFKKKELAEEKNNQNYEQFSNNEIVFSCNITLHGRQYFDTYSMEFRDKGSTDLDRRDGYKLFSLNNKSINLYSTLGTHKLQKNVLPRQLESPLEIPLSFDVNGRSSLTFKWDALKNIPSGWQVLLIDKKRNREINLRTHKNYRFNTNLLESEGQSAISEKDTLLNITNYSNSENEESRFVLSFNPNADDVDEIEDIETIALKPNYPNPFNSNSSTTIPFELDEDMEIKLTVWNMIGQKVATLVDGMEEAGQHDKEWKASNLPSGMYIARLEAGGQVYIRKMTLIK